MKMTRTNLPLLQQMCKTAGKIVPTEWPDGLLGIGFDMRAWVETQETLPKKAGKTKPKTVKPETDE